MSGFSARSAVVGTLIGFAVFDLAVVLAARTDAVELGASTVVDAFALSIFLAQATLAGAWLSLSPAKPGVRTVQAGLWIVVLTCVQVAAVGTVSEDYSHIFYLFGWLAVYVALVAAAISVARMAGGALHWQGSPVSARQFQIRIVHGLTAMAVLAVFGALNIRVQWAMAEDLAGDAGPFACLALASVTTLWGALSNSKLAIRLAVVAAVVAISAIGFAALLNAYFGGDSADFPWAAWLFAFQTFLIGAPLYSFRRIGYRFTRRRAAADVRESLPA